MDIGTSLQDLLNGRDDGKRFNRIDQESKNNPTELWRSEVIRIYFQSMNGFRLVDDDTDLVDSFLQMGLRRPRSIVEIAT
jgi:hypothetical protein